MAILPKPVHRFNANPYKNLNAIICRNRKIHLTIHMESQGTGNSQKNLEKEEKSRRTTLSGLKTYCKATVIKMVWYWHKDRHVDQWNRTEGP